MSDRNVEYTRATTAGAASKKQSRKNKQLPDEKSMKTAESAHQEALRVRESHAQQISSPSENHNGDVKNKAVPPLSAASGDQKSRVQMTKAERRAIQEAQRAAKAEGKPYQHSAKSAAVPASKQQQQVGGSSTTSTTLGLEAQRPLAPKSTQKTVVASKIPSATASSTAVTVARQQSVAATVAAERSGTSEIFSHLQSYQCSLPYDDRFARPPKSSIHPAFIRLGAMNTKRVLDGSNARCVALLYAFKQVIRDYVTPPDKDLSRDLEAKIKPYVNFLTQCRPMSVSMGNAVRHVKHLITNSPSNVSEQVAKEKLLDEMDFFINEKILLAGEAISKTYACEKINSGDNILTYAWSDLVTKVLCDAHRMGRRFSVTVVDSRPRMEGRETIRRLVAVGIPCSYVSITAVSYVMPEVSKVLLGAESLLANGYVMSHVGTSQICLVAKAFNKPVLVCCETYKFCERVQTDSIVNNELGNPYDVALSSLDCSRFSVGGAGAEQADDGDSATVVAVARVDEGDKKQATPYLSRLNLLYDVTPPDLITVVITEVGMVPCTSVPVVLRVKHAFQN